jgi:four helix bundle protein
VTAAGATRDYKDLLVWQKGIALVKQVYSISRQFPPDERFGLAIQVRRAAVSIPSNIAEGQARHTSKEFVLFLSHAEGSVAEVDTQLTLAMELSFCSRSELSDAFQLVLELRRMLNSLRRKLLAREH